MSHTKKNPRYIYGWILAFKQIMNLTIMIKIRNAQLLGADGCRMEDLALAGL